MKVRLDSDEWYPVYSVRESDRYGLEVTATPEVLRRWAAALEAFEKAQEEMSALYDAAADVERARRAAERAAKEATEKAEREQQARQRREEAAEREARRAEMWAKLEASGGVAYDAQGNRIGVVMPGISGGGSVRIEP